LWGEPATLLIVEVCLHSWGVSRQSQILRQSNQSNRNWSFTAVDDDGWDQFLNGELIG
jgi:hypothetical protein